MYFYSDSMINFMEEPTLELVGNKLTTYNEKDRKKPFFNPFTFNNLTEKEVKEIYAYVKGIDQNDIFARKALETSKKKDLVKILDTELVEKYNG